MGDAEYESADKQRLNELPKVDSKHFIPQGAIVLFKHPVTKRAWHMASMNMPQPEVEDPSERRKRIIAHIAKSYKLEGEYEFVVFESTIGILSTSVSRTVEVIVKDVKSS